MGLTESSRQPTVSRLRSGVARYMPGLALVGSYRRAWLRHDLVAGLSVAAVALPTGIAYAELAGFSPVVGLYSAIFPLFAYALFGSSRQLISNTPTPPKKPASAQPPATGSPSSSRMARPLPVGATALLVRP